MALPTLNTQPCCYPPNSIPLPFQQPVTAQQLVTGQPDTPPHQAQYSAPSTEVTDLANN